MLNPNFEQFGFLKHISSILSRDQKEKYEKKKKKKKEED